MKKVKSTVKKPHILKVDPDLDQYQHKGLFQKKIDKANYILKTAGLPKFSS